MVRIYQRTNKKGSIWYLDYLVEGRRVRKRVGTSRRMAELALADVRVKRERKELGFAAKDKSFPEFVREYMDYAQSNKAPKSYERDQMVFKHFSEFMRVAKLNTITPVHLETYKTRRQEQGAQPATVNRELNTVKAMLNKAVAWGYLSKSPAQTVKKLREPKRQIRFLSPHEIKTLLEQANERMRHIIVTLLYTGLRRGELIHLVWGDLDFKTKLLSVQAKQGWNPKDYEVRHIPLNDKLFRILHGQKKGESPYIFSNESGGMLNGNILSRDFRKLARRCGIKGASIHTLRHTFASYLAMNRVDLYTIQKLLGHSSVKTTEIYAHLAPDYLRSAITKLSFQQEIPNKKQIDYNPKP